MPSLFSIAPVNVASSAYQAQRRGKLLVAAILLAVAEALAPGGAEALRGRPVPPGRLAFIETANRRPVIEQLVQLAPIRLRYWSHGVHVMPATTMSFART